MEHICSKEREIGQISTDLERLVKVIEGNGQPGLLKTVPELSIKIEMLLENIKANETKSLNGWQKAGVIISGILGFASVVTAIIIKLI